MKAILTLAAGLTLLLATTAAPFDTAEAQSWKKRSGKTGNGYDRRYRRSAYPHYSRRDIDRLPIRITQPPGAGHYIYDNYPLWAARAFQPTWNR